MWHTVPMISFCERESSLACWLSILDMSAQTLSPKPSSITASSGVDNGRGDFSRLKSSVKIKSKLVSWRLAHCYLHFFGKMVEIQFILSERGIHVSKMRQYFGFSLSRTTFRSQNSALWGLLLPGNAFLVDFRPGWISPLDRLILQLLQVQYKNLVRRVHVWKFYFLYF